MYPRSLSPAALNLPLPIVTLSLPPSLPPSHLLLPHASYGPSPSPAVRLAPRQTSPLSLLPASRFLCAPRVAFQIPLSPCRFRHPFASSSSLIFPSGTVVPPFFCSRHRHRPGRPIDPRLCTQMSCRGSSLGLYPSSPSPFLCPVRRNYSYASIYSAPLRAPYYETRAIVTRPRVQRIAARARVSARFSSGFVCNVTFRYATPFPLSLPPSRPLLALLHPPPQQTNQPTTTSTRSRYYCGAHFRIVLNLYLKIVYMHARARDIIGLCRMFFLLLSPLSA